MSQSRSRSPADLRIVAMIAYRVTRPMAMPVTNSGNGIPRTPAVMQTVFVEIGTIALKAMIIQP